MSDLPETIDLSPNGVMHVERRGREVILMWACPADQRNDLFSIAGQIRPLLDAFHRKHLPHAVVMPERDEVFDINERNIRKEHAAWIEENGKGLWTLAWTLEVGEANRTVYRFADPQDATLFRVCRS